ncbi:hypothetical protein RHGRI_005940 [Rhododendron griersonianum]|uniref:Uncharacterized protein n=1 Tax=Rhododendron griersonianum TaxID=479676 RepID=A0AAV6LFA5_9ERIC|nr:hypothetical protein RHGRI_005940 [Rhododendron griersonianum]
MRRFTQSQAVFLEATFVLLRSWLAFCFSSDSESYEMDAPYGFRFGRGFANRTPASPPAIGSNKRVLERYEPEHEMEMIKFMSILDYLLYLLVTIILLIDFSAPETSMKKHGRGCAKGMKKWGSGAKL